MNVSEEVEEVFLVSDDDTASTDVDSQALTDLDSESWTRRSAATRLRQERRSQTIFCEAF